MPKILYIAYWGALEQLGQSLIVPAVKKLVQMGAEITLITFEKPADLLKKDEMRRIREMLEADCIEWIPLQYHKDPKIPATLFDIAQGTARSLQKRLTKRFDIIHARTFIGGLIGMLIAPLTGAKFVYHNEGFYPDEQVDSGVWAKDSRPHRVAKQLENKMYSRADGIIALSHRAKTEIEKLPAVQKKQTPVIVVPSCVDLERFQLLPKDSSAVNDEIKFVYVGSVGGRYDLSNIGRFIAAAKNRNPNVRLQIYSKGNREYIARTLAESGLSETDWNLASAAYVEIPKLISEYDAGIHFLQRGISEHSGSPTKIGEYWAVGLPVVITSNMSDNDTIVKRENLGSVISEHSEENYIEAFDEISELIGNPTVRNRCRQAAENHYSLDAGCRDQFALYQKLVENTGN